MVEAVGGVVTEPGRVGGWGPAGRRPAAKRPPTGREAATGSDSDQKPPEAAANGDRRHTDVTGGRRRAKPGGRGKARSTASGVPAGGGGGTQAGRIGRVLLRRRRGTNNNPADATEPGLSAPAPAPAPARGHAACSQPRFDGRNRRRIRSVERGNAFGSTLHAGMARAKSGLGWAGRLGVGAGAT